MSFQKFKSKKKFNDVNSFNNHINNNKEMITYFKDKNNKSKKKYEKYKTLTTILKSFDTFFIIATTSSSITLSLAGVGLKAIPKSTGTACGLSSGNKVINEIIIKNTMYTKNDMKKTNKQLNLSIIYTENLYKII